MQRILGIDPGLRVTGYGATEVSGNALEPTLLEAGVIKLDHTLSIEQRLVHLHRDLDELIIELTPTCIAVENLFVHYRHPRTAILMAHARGVILLCAQQRDLSVEHLSSTEVKRAITGYGHASKQQIQLAIQTQCRLSELPTPSDVADAIAIALACARRIALTGLMGR